jgi:ATP-dependent RNA helicase RhlE
LTDLTFAALGLAEPLQTALQAENYVTPTPIQAQSIPLLMTGRDLLGIAQTGTGKTAAFALPILHHLATNEIQLAPKSVRALVLAPTRELAVQIADSFKAYGRNIKFRGAIVLGGVGQNPQVQNLARGVDVLVATPGRLLDLMAQGHVKLDKVEMLVLDEADRMLDMGFIVPVRKLVAALPRDRQTMFFSATMPREVEQLARDILKDPAKVEVTPPATTVERIEQKLFFVDQPNKQALLHEMLKSDEMSRVIVFTRTKHGANRVALQLEAAGVKASAIHGNKSQSARQQALNDFKAGKLRILVATDLASRGIDVDNISHVVNFELPEDPDSYVHRIGRTARAGTTGIAISFCCGQERGLLKDIERLTRLQLTPENGHPYQSEARPEPMPPRGQRSQGRGNGGGGRGQPGRDSRAGNSNNRFRGRAA